jgi:hypothetical protein
MGHLPNFGGAGPPEGSDKRPQIAVRGATAHLPADSNGMRLIRVSCAALALAVACAVLPIAASAGPAHSANRHAAAGAKHHPGAKNRTKRERPSPSHSRYTPTCCASTRLTGAPNP